MTMAICASCKKEIFFSEKTKFLGADMHASCLKCHRCRKVISIGKHQHLEKDQHPLCCHCHAVMTGQRSHARGPAETHSYYGAEYGK